MSYKIQPVTLPRSCAECGKDTEVTFHPGDPGQPDPNEPNACPPEEGYFEPEDCEHCSYALLVYDDPDQICSDAAEAAFERDSEIRHAAQEAEGYPMEDQY